MPEYGAEHKILVEHTDQGLEEEQQLEGGEEREVYLAEVRYILVHPTGEDGIRDCWGDAGEGDKADGLSRPDCPILEEIRNIGWADAFGVEAWNGLKRVWRHFEGEGTYPVVAWGEKYCGPEGDDYDGGLSIGECVPFPRTPLNPVFELAEADAADANLEGVVIHGADLIDAGTIAADNEIVASLATTDEIVATNVQVSLTDLAGRISAVLRAKVGNAPHEWRLEDVVDTVVIDTLLMVDPASPVTLEGFEKAVAETSEGGSEALRR